MAPRSRRATIFLILTALVVSSLVLGIAVVLVLSYFQGRSPLSPYFGGLLPQEEGIGETMEAAPEPAEETEESAEATEPGQAIIGEAETPPETQP